MQGATTPERVGIRHRVGARLQGLNRRVLHLRAMASPRSYIANPWLRLAAAAIVGYRLGRPETVARAIGGTVLQAVLRTVLVNVATSAVRDAISPETIES